MSVHAMSPVLGQMMNKPMLISSIIEHADRYFGKMRLYRGGLREIFIATITLNVISV